VSAALGGPVLWLYARHDLHALHHTLHDSVSFIILLGSLFVIRMGGTAIRRVGPARGRS
jgi:hypothetical protein